MMAAGVPMAITGRTAVMLILADPVAQIVGTHVLNRAFAEAGLDVAVVPLQVRPGDLAAALELIRRTPNVVGTGITIPHKIAATGLVDGLTEAARAVGAVNFIRRNADGSLTGTNVDGAGFLAGLVAEEVAPEGMRVAQIGAGGVGRAIAFALAGAGVAELHIVNRDAGKAAALAAAVRGAAPDCRVRAASLPGLSGFDLVVNATALGMRPGDPLPHNLTGLKRHAVAADVVMTPAVTPMLAAAARLGCKTVPGMAMMRPQAGLVARFFDLRPRP